MRIRTVWNAAKRGRGWTAWQRDAETANNGEAAANDDADDDDDDDDGGGCNGDAASVSVICGPICIFYSRNGPKCGKDHLGPILLFVFAAVPPW